MSDRPDPESGQPPRAPDLSNRDTPDSTGSRADSRSRADCGGGAGDGGPAADGLDLARTFTRAAAGSPARKATWRKKRERPAGKQVNDHSDDRDPQLLDATLGRLIADHGWELDLRVHGVFGRWAELVGPEVAGHATPESFAEGRLVVRTDSTAWATQLRLLAATVVRRLNEELGHGTVTAIEVLGPRAPSWTKGRLSTRDSRGPRDTYG